MYCSRQILYIISGVFFIILFIFVTHPKQFRQNSHGLHTELNTSAKNDMETIIAQVKTITQCLDKPAAPRTQLCGVYWVLYNYIVADRPFKCHESITLTTHADFMFLDNLVPLVERWKGPISIALHAPGTDFQSTVDSIRYLRDCSSSLVKEYVTFHLYFSSDHFPKKVPQPTEILRIQYPCSKNPPFLSMNSNQTYRFQKQMLYPINVGRNIAREMAVTHFILASDIELYPSLNIIPHFLYMIARDDGPLLSTNSRVFPLHLFEVPDTQHIPDNKTILQAMLQQKLAQPFHKSICAECHRIPNTEEWYQTADGNELNVFYVAKRTKIFNHWEPIFIGTHADPPYDERFSWEGMSDKMTQAFAMCVLNYDFLILDNAFLVHKPGIKKFKVDSGRSIIQAKSTQALRNQILQEYVHIYGSRTDCQI